MTNDENLTPATPRVISPSPEPTSFNRKGGSSYFTSKATSTNTYSFPPADSDLTARSRPTRRRPDPVNPEPHGTAQDGAKVEDTNYLSPASLARSAGRYLRDVSRSPSPLGLIPIHQNWRYFIHRHELPRKALHLSIGFLTLHLYSTNTQTSQIHPLLLRLLLPIALTDLFRFSYAPFNTFYIRCLGPFMRESEAHDKWNGVIWYLLGVWTVMRWCPKDVAVVAVCLLSWCDTAASTVGRAYGKRTGWQLRRGKSVVGSAAALLVGIGTALVFWGWWAPRCMSLGYVDGNEVRNFAFTGVLSLPRLARDMLGWTREEASISGGLALAVMSTVAGFVACVSEATDVFGLDDNVTIPVLSGLALSAFLWVFGGT